MKRVKKIVKTICTDDEIRLYRLLKPSVQMVKSVRTDGENGFTQRISRHPVTDFTGTSCGFTHNQLRF